MGRIKSLMVKRAAKQLLKKTSETDTYNESFEHNKKILGSGNLPSKSIRNKIAGYLARLKRMEKNPRPIKPKEIIQEEEQ